ncbi:LOW QUALITY PROTEIN: hypothetical protein ACHAW5_000094 [Stephanodiscus triporus]|uniref:Uncharacterized protein n=1 Tax=Stephanodiscus triporus TaxID=2934178 RepID=A0ABD3QWI0_9STRA
MRVFSLDHKDMERFTSSCGIGDDATRNGLIHLLIGGNSNFLGNSEGVACRKPLVLNGHGSSPVQMVVSDKNIGSVGQLASRGADEVVILWDVIAETRLFRLLGHRVPVNGITILRPSGGEASGVNGMVTSGLDGLVKVWDLNDSLIVHPPGKSIGGNNDIGRRPRWRLVTGCADGQIRVRLVDDFKPEGAPTDTEKEVGARSKEAAESDDKQASDEDDNISRYMGLLLPQTSLNIRSSNKDGIESIHFHPSGRYVGVCCANDRLIEIYAAHSELDIQKKQRRRLQRSKITTKRGLLDNPESKDEQDDEVKGDSLLELSPEAVKAMNQFEFHGTICAAHNNRGFAFALYQERGGGLFCALSCNALEVHSLPRPPKQSPGTPVTGEKVSSLDMYGQPTDICSVVLSSDDTMMCTVLKSIVKIWNVANRSCLRSIRVPSGSKGTSCYCLCATHMWFLAQGRAI